VENDNRGGGFWTYFGLGMLAGLVYSWFKHPAGCGCLLLVVVVVAVALVWAWWPWSGLVILLVGTPFYIPRFIRWLREER
jgi:hypothetical protein